MSRDFVGVVVVAVLFFLILIFRWVEKESRFVADVFII